ncbi:LysR family transcriptional regulator [Azospirillum rugosum]|uniref:DNA-binding transcriptional LysR family regulator n=1 Tax=Azospirillum rugosum TaxID=416170 RepID=A0ABS4SPP2_9PROT|nr:LysR family transcriptional regulator [Azospirillum rugosum]MBP2294524.1 DNA-binding transcriptional LysR family regulator [Azospirillum rugosum]MDQ0529029.1 DNA-binding transcriptional LysR family regulator [Azospirillum rugosum]
MREVNLAGIDLNLLVALAALLDERNVTRAAGRVGLSQPAMSRALGRLRALFGDKLLVRTAAGLEPTPRAEALAAPLARVLAEVGRMVQPPDFDPAAQTGTVRIATVDYQTVVLLPRLLAHFAEVAPNLDVEVVLHGPAAEEGIASGTIDLAIGVFDVAEAGYYQQTLYREDFACVVRADHPALQDGPMTAERFAGLRHAFLTVGRDSSRAGFVDAALDRLGLARRIVLRTPHFLAAPLIVAESDLVLTLPRRLAEHLRAMVPLAVFDPPVPMPAFAITQLWHERRHGDPAHAWLRAAVLTCAAAPRPTT